MNELVSAKREAGPLLNRLRLQSPGANLESIFRSKDPGNTEHMKTYDIEEILKANRIIITSDEFNLLGKFILKDFEGKMNYVELCRQINGAVNATPTAPLPNTPGYIPGAPNPAVIQPPVDPITPGFRHDNRPGTMPPEPNYIADMPPLPNLHADPSFNPALKLNVRSDTTDLWANT